MLADLEEDGGTHTHPDAVTQTNVTPDLLKLPTEILALILQRFTPPLSLRRVDLKPHWHCSVVDTSALKPISQTCRRLRDVVQTLSLVVKTVIISEEASFDADKMHALNQDVPLNVYISFVHPTPQVVRDWYVAEAHRIQELHITRLGNLNMDLWVPLLTVPAPKLRFLSITSSGVAWLPPRGSLLSLPQASQLRHLTLSKVCFLPRNHFASLTHLALINVRVPRFDKTLLTFLSRCPMLVSLVLLNSRESIMERATTTLTVHLPRLQRVTLENPDDDAVYLAALPHNRGMAFQLFNPGVKEDVARSIISKYSPNPHTLRVVHLEHPPVSRDFFNPTPWRRTYDDWDSASLTSIGPSGTFHVRRNQPHDIDGPYYTAVRAMLEDKSDLASVRELWLVGMLASRAIQDTDSPTMTIPWQHLDIRHGSAYMSFSHRVAIAMRDVMVGLPAVETLVYVLPYTLEPNLWILPSTTHPSFASRNLKTLRLVICHGIGLQNTRDSGLRRPELKLGKACECLATGNYAYLDALVLQMAPNVVIDEGEILRISKYVPTVKVERIDAIPEMTLPEYCREPSSQCSRAGALW
ncbi:hypothetical protein K466DRAFT_667036 [Polyporus arcularius HHB13444]|uniref:F-box domain-containing protein n=1 Tax=Polyporus arcularius HHB13444 TaxID=1314778 RepID=A0A5C3P6Y9_9APHY|nr:hypothetical protein K466DRAFT_667036 [Polyporus arcularius HHB13444]